MVPEGWMPTQIGDLAKFLSGGTPSKRKSEYWGGEESWISGKDLKTHYLSESIDTLTSQGFQVAKKAPQGASLILVRGMTLLKDFPVGYATKQVAFNQDLKALIPHPFVDGLFLSFLLVAEKHKIRQLVSTAGHGTGRLDTSSIQEYPINIPPLAEQKKIAEILSTWDMAITTTQQVLANSQQQKKALMQQLLTGKQRLLDKNGVRFSGEWIHGRLGDLCSFKGGSAFKEIYQGQSDGELPFIKVSDMNLPGNEKSIEHSNNWVSYEMAKLMKAKPFPEQSIVFAKVGAALLLNRRRVLSRPTIIDNNMMAAIPSSAAETEFLYQLLMAIDFARFVQEGAVPSINQGDLASFKISYPSLEEQQKIAAVLSAADQEITNLQQRLDHLKQEKKALMQQLLTGKRRVKVDNKELV